MAIVLVGAITTIMLTLVLMNMRSNQNSKWIINSSSKLLICWDFKADQHVNFYKF